MEGASNGGMLYHEVQESKLCAVHCVNTVLQGPFFSEFDLAAVASDLDRKERQVMLAGGAASGDFLSDESHNVSLDGDFSIQVLQRALEVWDLQVIPLDSPVAEHAQVDPELENAFICHLQDHWFCIRKVNGEWYNFDSLYAAPHHLSKFYLSAYLDSLKGFGWSIFLVRGNFPKECPLTSSEASNVYGQWLSPEDAERITKSCSSTQAPPQPVNPSQPHSDQFLPFGEAEMISEIEDEDLKAAIAASLIDSFPPTASAETVDPSPATASAEAADPSPATSSGKTVDPSPAKASAETVDSSPAKASSETVDSSLATASTETVTPQNENPSPQNENPGSKEKIQ
ncbi:hypothetical protein CJ030_MR5G002878 [Morella rubra]|uniref:ubiquitinyl hydrolase 1 n=1 Tax=Morella rubra TaxID=262757 RepID=A0A6A1VRT1_9ROSI|nr:hypothetical protein CJ030_MR5G002878 [Morella rubra]